MARIASLQVGGYFPTPVSVMNSVTKLLFRADENSVPVIIDPCGGEGEAVQMLGDRLQNCHINVVEMEQQRCTKIRGRLTNYNTVVCGDFFRLEAEPYAGGGGDLLWLNPPYDTDKEMGRLEEKFLQRAYPLLRMGGLLIFVIPHASLKASAMTLAQNFTNMHCYRFPDDEWDYKQVLFFARRQPRMEKEFVMQATLDKILAWAGDPFQCEVIHDAKESFTLHGHGKSLGFYTWEMRGVDLISVRESYTPWVSEAGPVNGIAPPESVVDMFNKVYPLASKPRAVHLAAALSAGIFNGVRVENSDGNLPSLLIKGVFDKEFRGIEDKEDKDGVKVGEVQVQQPKLKVTILDLSKGTFHEVRQDNSLSDEVDVSDMSMRDLLEHYGPSLMAGMLEACPVLHDPDNDPNPIPMSDRICRPLYPAQMESVRCVIKMQEKYPDRGSIVLGEIGTGKSSVALAVFATMNKNRGLIVCPPHLLDGWKEQIDAVLTGTPTYVLKTIEDVRNFEKHKGAPCIAILSREAAKLGHGWADMTSKSCPSCGKKAHGTDFAKKRTRCSNYLGARLPANAEASWMTSNLHAFLPSFPDHPISKLVEAKIHKKALKRSAALDKAFKLTPPMVDALRSFIPMIPKSKEADALRVLLAWAAPSLAVEVAEAQPEGWDTHETQKTTLNILCGTPFEEAQKVIEALPVPSAYGYSYGQKSRNYVDEYHEVRKGNSGSVFWTNVCLDEKGYFRDGDEKLYQGSKEAMDTLMRHILSLCRYKTREKCGEPLFYAKVPSRVPLASWIQKRAPNCFDFLILDEAHEFSGRDSAQTSAAQKLMSSKVPTVLLTGSLLNGYAESVYMNMYGISPEFRQKFGRDSVAAFIDRYGYWKQIAQDKDYEGKIVEFGTNSDRVIRTTRKAGVSPGILPLFQLEYILPMATTLQKEDLNIGIPPCKEVVWPLNAEGDLYSNYENLLSSLKAEIKATKFTPGLAGKLWGAFASLPSYLDLACVGNRDDSTDFEIRWPENVPDVGGLVIASVPLLDPSILLPKEQMMLDRIQEEIDQGRNVIVMTWHTRLIPRIHTLIQNAGHKVITLDAGKVPTGKRQAWIDSKVVKKGIQVMVCNPMVIQTGLNNLVHFGTEIWMENPTCNAIIYRQACGRIDRIGQTVPSHIVFPVYENTAQHHQHKLLMHKVGVSKSVDGLDPEEALRAAGIIDSEFTGFSVGKQLYNMMESLD